MESWSWLIRRWRRSRVTWFCGLHWIKYIIIIIVIIIMVMILRQRWSQILCKPFSDFQKIFIAFFTIALVADVRCGQQGQNHLPLQPNEIIFSTVTNQHYQTRRALPFNPSVSFTRIDRTPPTFTNRPCSPPNGNSAISRGRVRQQKSIDSSLD